MKVYCAFLTSEARRGFKKLATDIGNFIYARFHHTVYGWGLTAYGQALELDIKPYKVDDVVVGCPWNSDEDLIDELDDFFKGEQVLFFDEKTFLDISKNLDKGMLVGANCEES